MISSTRTSTSTMSRSPWHEQHDEAVGQTDQHVLLGQILERSTSAPPISTEQRKLALTNERDGHNNFLFGNNNQGDSGLFSPSGRDSAPLQGWGGEEPASSNYPSTLLSDALLSSGLSDSRARSASMNFSEQRSANHVAHPSSSHGSSIAFADDLGHSMVRSHSAAPTFMKNSNRGVGPPPGLSDQRRDSRDHGYGGENSLQRHGLRRPASAGLINEEHDSGSSVLASLGIESRGSGAAVRPAPKTLMDLIQEDTTTQRHDEFGGYNPAAAGLGLTRSHTAGPSLYDRDDFGGYLERSRTASPPARYDSFGDGSQSSNRFEQRKQPFRPEPQSVHESHMSGLTQQADRLQVGPGGQQQYRPAQPEPRQVHNAQYVTIPVSQLQQRGPGQMGHHQEPQRPPGQMGHHQEPQRLPGQMGHHQEPQRLPGQMGHHQEPQRPAGQMGHHQEPQRPQPRSMYAPNHISPPQSVSPHQQFDGQQVYYANNQPNAPMGVNQGMPPSGQTLTMATLPNGQTVYLNMSPYGFTPAQYPSAPPQTHPQHANMIHSQHQQVQHGHEYVTVMPSVQPGGQVAYWQGGDSASMGQTVIVNPHGGGPVMMQRGGNSGVMQETPPPGRMKENSERGATAKSAGKGRRGGGGSGQTGGRRDEVRGKHPVSSQLLEEFRATKNRDWTMLDIKGNVVEFCQDQNGSRFIQQRLEIGNASEQQVVMAEVLPAVRQLRNDVFGNYVVQKLLEFGTHPMKEQLRETLKGEMLSLSLQMYGCRVVQKALETLDEDDLPKLLLEFHHNVLSCIHDQNGNHVIQKCIEVMSTKAKQAYAVHDGERAQFFGEQIDFIINDVLDNVTPLSCHPYGCRVLQRILEHCVEPKKVRALNEISKCHKVLLDDQYGNYVIQHVLQYGRHEDRQSVIQIVIANGLLQLSKQKFASNVVEKLLKYGTPSQRNVLVREMLKVVDDPNTGGSSVVLLMVRDAYANYVVQTTLDVVSEGEEKRLLLEELNAHSTQLVRLDESNARTLLQHT